MRFAAAVAVALGIAPPALADLDYLETEELRIVYYDPAETYLVPHATQSYLAGLAAHRRLFGYIPDGHVNVLLDDFSDRANASTIAAPRDRIFLDIAPTNEPYETVSSAEPFAWVALHELTHLVMNDGASPTDMRYRHFFHGKVAVDGAHPETLLYNYLTVPRSTAPRWYQEGGAVFTETWLSGGVGRAQGGYDEMVFRAMVLDNARFYDPLALVSKGTEVDFQTGANAYLYGTRFMDYLALTYGPERLLEWWRRDAESRRYYADDFRRVFGLPLNESWHQWIDFEHSFQQQNLRAVHEHPLTEFHDLTQRDLGAVSRSYPSPDGSKLFAGVKYPGQVAHLVAIGRADGTVTDLKEIKGASGYTVTDKDRGHAITCTETVTGAYGHASATTAAVHVPAAITLTKVSETHKTWAEKHFRHGPPVGTTFSYTLNMPATVVLKFTRQAKGRKVKRKCVAQTHKNAHKPSCKLTVKAGTLKTSGRTGKNKLVFAGKVGGKKLAPGSYEVTITAETGPGNANHTLRFTIAR